jgi:hypothetical protein
MRSNYKGKSKSPKDKKKSDSSKMENKRYRSVQESPELDAPSPQSAIFASTLKKNQDIRDVIIPSKLS